MQLAVGILNLPEICFFLKGDFRNKNNETLQAGEYLLFRENENIYLKHAEKKQVVTLPLLLSPIDEQRTEFELADVTIGIDFHWERKENERFKGSLKIIQENERYTAINLLDVEDYLLSVISSEMSATASAEFLKAHAVISRSWLLAQKEKAGNISEQWMSYTSLHETDEEYIQWFDREDHLHFDVCADDHCQRYQGIAKATTPAVHQAVQATCGEVLTYNGKICDARFSKCCGGISEQFENVWESVQHPYLKAVYDASDEDLPDDLTREDNSNRWVSTQPDVFCHTTDKHILKQVLNNYDQETCNFFRWEVYYSQTDLSEVVQKKLAMDFGDILDLIPMERGKSGRIIRLKIVGSRRTRIIGKELIIRKALSESHLYSSAFIVEKVMKDTVIQGYRLSGAGWGHGVGLCQIGAAVMGEKGYSYREILAHYFSGSKIEKRY